MNTLPILMPGVEYTGYQSPVHFGILMSPDVEREREAIMQRNIREAYRTHTYKMSGDTYLQLRDLYNDLSDANYRKVKAGDLSLCAYVNRLEELLESIQLK